MICEIIIEKLCNYYSMLPEYFELSEELIDITIEVAPNLKLTFPVLTNTYLEFRDYIFFFNKLCNTIRNVKLKEKLRIFLFNKFLLGCVQGRLLSKDIRVVRSNLQYFIFFLKTIKNTEIVNLLFNFIFGFNDKTSRNGIVSEEVKNLLSVNTPSESSEEVITKEEEEVTTEKNYFEEKKKKKKTVIEELDLNYSKHENVFIGLALLNNLTSNKEKLNIVILTLYEAFFEKCPYMTIHMVLLPFTEVCLKQMVNTDYLLQNKKSYPDITCFFNLLSIINDNKQFEFSEVTTNIENNLNRSYSHYINNDLDFYYYYLNQRQDQENFQYVEKEEGEGEGEGEIYDGNKLDNKFMSKSPKKKRERDTTSIYDDHLILTEMRNTLTKMPVKFNFDYFTTNTKQMINNNKNKLFDEVAEIEEEFNNIHICFLKSIIEKFVNFTNNTHLENLYYTVQYFFYF